MNQIKHFFLRFFECQNLFEISIKKLDNIAISNRFIFKIITIDEIKYFKQISIPEFRGSPYFELVQKRLLSSSNEYICLAIIDKEKDKLAYSCWLRFQSFLEEKLKMQIDIKKHEAFFFDAYAIPDYRGYGLHTYMMIQRINYCSENKICKAYIAIQCFNTAALKVKNKLKFNLKKRRVYYKKGSIKHFIKLLYNKLIK